MGISFVDRKSTYPGRYKAERADGTTEYLTLTRADSPTVEGTPLNAATLNGVLRGHTPWNLLDNSDFTNPVNQRGKTTYNTIGYTIDRWHIGNNTSVVTVGDSCVSFSGNGGNATPKQYVPITPAMRGKTVTGVVWLENGEPYVFGNGVIPSAAVSTNTLIGNSKTIMTGASVALSEFTNGCLRVMFTISSGVTLRVKHIALYYGSYTVDTVPDYQPKGYAAELLECQRYCFRISQALVYRSSVIGTNTIQTLIPINVPMRVKPIIEAGEFTIYSLSNIEQADFTFSIGYMGDNAARIDAAKTSHGLTDGVLRVNSAVILSADIT